jgi:hypothetical protein
MIYIQFTGKGWLTYALVPVIVVLGVIVGATVMNISQDRYLGAGTTAVAIAVIGGSVQWFTGRLLNGPTPTWELAEHTTYGIPMELTAPFYPVLGLPMLAIVLGQATSPLWGWLLVLGAAIPLWMLVRVARLRKRAE